MPQFVLLQHHAWKYYDIGILRYLKLYKCDRIAPQVEHQQSLKELHMASNGWSELKRIAQLDWEPMHFRSFGNSWLFVGSAASFFADLPQELENFASQGTD